MLTPSISSLNDLPDGNLIVPVYQKFNADTITPVSAYLSLSDGAQKPGFLLESVEKGDQLARYSFLGVNPRGKVAVEGDRVRVPDFLKTPETNDPFELVRELMKDWDYSGSGELPAFTGGLVGYFGYETIGSIEPTVPVKTTTDKLFFPDLLLYYVDTLLIFDHVERLGYLVGHIYTGQEKPLEQQYQEVQKKLRGWEEKLASRVEAPPLEKTSQDFVQRVGSNFHKADYFEAVERIKQYIRAGDAFQVVLSQRFELEDNNHAFNIYRGLRSLNPSPYMIYYDFEDFQLVGASPEMLVQKEGDLVRTRPIAGTRRRGASPAEDSLLAEELKNDSKEQAEHTMLVDLGRNDLGRVCRPGTVKVNERAVVEKYSHVMHLVSDVTGKILPDYDAIDVLKATFPAGTVSGAPKVRAMQIIDECEPQRRGPYAGAAGFFSFNGDLNSCIIIRTLIKAGVSLYVQAGGGIVVDSRAEREYEETREKSRALLRAVETLPDVRFI